VWSPKGVSTVNIVEKHNILINLSATCIGHFNSTTRYNLSNYWAVDQLKKEKKNYNILVLLQISFAAPKGSEGDYTAS